MPVSNLVKFSLILLFSLIASAVYSQYDVAQVNLSQDMTSLHDQLLGRGNTGLIYGEYQKFERASRSTHAFYLNDSWSTERIKYRGQVYENIPLMYNTFLEVLTIRHPSDLQYYSQPIKLIQHQIDWFEYEDHLFRYIEVENLSPGLYDELYSGNHFMLLKKRRKVSQTSSELEVLYQPDDYTIIKYQGNYFQVNGRSSWLRVFKGNKELRKAIKNYSKRERIRFNGAFDTDLINLASYINETIPEIKGGQQR